MPAPIISPCPCDRSPHPLTAHLSLSLSPCAAQELANRRQYLAYLNTLYTAFKNSGSHIEQLTRMLLQEMEALKQLVGSRSSVTKEQVEPQAQP